MVLNYKWNNTQATDKTELCIFRITLTFATSLAGQRGNFLSDCSIEKLEEPFLLVLSPSCLPDVAISYFYPESKIRYCNISLVQEYDCGLFSTAKDGLIVFLSLMYKILLDFDVFLLSDVRVSEYKILECST
jgi:hypothetical protein